jgi:hypothetical protein
MTAICGSATRGDACDRMAFALSSYNGGEGWLRREQRAPPRPALRLIAGSAR